MLAILTRRERANILIEARNTYAAVPSTKCQTGTIQIWGWQIFYGLPPRLVCIWEWFICSKEGRQIHSKESLRLQFCALRSEPFRGESERNSKASVYPWNCPISKKNISFARSFDSQEHVGDWTATALATDGTALGVATTLTLEESFQARLRNILKTLMQVGCVTNIFICKRDANWADDWWN